MTQEEFDALNDTDRAFLKLQGLCSGCGCDVTGIFTAHSEWCKAAPRIRFNPGHEWAKHSANRDRMVITTSRRQGKSVFANMVKEFNKLFGKEYENTNS
jgi:hypothetical protein